MSSTAVHPQHLSTATPAPRPRASLLSRLATRYVDGWTWYARAGFSPPAPEPGFPASRALPAAACCIDLRAGRAPRFALLFGTAGGR